MPAGSFSFVVAGKPGRLTAIDHGQGTIHQFSQTRGDWIEAGRIANHRMPRWAWSAVAANAGFALPTAEGPFWVMTSVTGGLRTLRIEGWSKDGDRCIGGAGIGRLGCFIPVLKKDGGLQVAWRKPDEDTAWSLLPVRNAPAEADFAADGWLGRPARSSAEDLFWTGAGGYPRVCSADAPENAAVWRSWREGFVGHPRFVAYRSATGSIWQLGREIQGGGYAYERLAADQGSAIERHAVAGPHLSAGTATFHGVRRYAVPWEDDYSSYPLDVAEFMLPLREFSVDSAWERRHFPVWIGPDDTLEHRDATVPLLWLP